MSSSAPNSRTVYRARGDQTRVTWCGNVPGPGALRVPRVSAGARSWVGQYTARRSTASTLPLQLPGKLGEFGSVRGREAVQVGHRHDLPPASRIAQVLEDIAQQASVVGRHRGCHQQPPRPSRPRRTWPLARRSAHSSSCSIATANAPPASLTREVTGGVRHRLILRCGVRGTSFAQLDIVSVIDTSPRTGAGSERSRGWIVDRSAHGLRRAGTNTHVRLFAAWRSTVVS